MNTFVQNIHPEELEATCPIIQGLPDIAEEDKEKETPIDFGAICSPCPIFNDGKIPSEEDCKNCAFYDEDEEDYDDYCDDEPDQFRDDVEADADALANAGWGVDEDYGFFGYDNDC